MTAGTESVPCPRGHLSTEPDYCSECGSKLSEAASVQENASGVSQNSSGLELCPDCGTLRENSSLSFCEVCGYNFVTGAHGEIAIVETSPALADPNTSRSEAKTLLPPAPQPLTTRWQVLVSVDPALRTAGSPEVPTGAEEFTLILTEPVLLIGRRDESRGIAPEIDLSLDEAVSRRHALLTVSPVHEVSLRDIGAANGTRLNDVELEPMVDYPLHHGDEITLGHWSRLRVQAVE